MAKRRSDTKARRITILGVAYLEKTRQITKMCYQGRCSYSVEKLAARRAGACDWEPRYYMFRVRFWRRGGFRPNSCDFFESKNQQQNFFQNLGNAGGAKEQPSPKSWRAAASAPAVQRYRPIAINSGRKIVVHIPVS
jgi:hypothetical protein